MRAAAAASLRELVETLSPEPALRDGLTAALSGADPVARAAALDALRVLRLGDTALFADSLADSDVTVRIAAVRALVSVDAAEVLARAATADPSREVRVAIAKALATVADGRLAATLSAAPGPDRLHSPRLESSLTEPALIESALTELVDDPDALVRAAAYEALGRAGCPLPWPDARGRRCPTRPGRYGPAPPPPCPSRTPASRSLPSPRPSPTRTPTSARPRWRH